MFAHHVGYWYLSYLRPDIFWLSSTKNLLLKFRRNFRVRLNFIGRKLYLTLSRTKWNFMPDTVVSTDILRLPIRPWMLGLVYLFTINPGITRLHFVILIIWMIKTFKLGLNIQPFKFSHFKNLYDARFFWWPICNQYILELL